MKIVLLLLLTVLTCTLSAQDCDDDFQRSTTVYVPKNLTQTAEQRSITTTRVQKRKACLKKTTVLAEIYWYAQSLAQDYQILAEPDSSFKYAMLALRSDTASFCEDYVDFHLASNQDDFPFKKHYLDVEDFEDYAKARKRCESYLKKGLEQEELHQQEELKELESSTFNKVYTAELKEILAVDQEERKTDNMNWDIQHSLDSLNRIKLDSLYEIYGFPSKSKVTKEGVVSAFMVLHHSTDCKWNEKWTLRFMNHYEENKLENIFSFYFYRNFNEQDGVCRHNSLFLEKLKTSEHSEAAKKFLDFTKWEDFFKDK